MTLQCWEHLKLVFPENKYCSAREIRPSIKCESGDPILHCIICVVVKGRRQTIAKLAHAKRPNNDYEIMVSYYSYVHVSSLIKFESIS